MASSKEYLNYILEQLSGLDEITYRLLVKPVKSAVSYMPTAVYEKPYDGAKDMLLVDEVDNKDFLTGLFHAMYSELPEPKVKKTASSKKL